MLRNKFTYIAILLFCLVLSGCYHNKTKIHGTAKTYSEKQLDSISFSKIHHYSRNYNFVVKSDSIVLYKQRPSSSMTEKDDTIIIHRHDNIVVVDTKTTQYNKPDSVWIQVARDQFTFGWISENNLLSNVVPDDPISQFISTFSDTHLLIFLVIISIIGASYIFHIIFKIKAKVVHFNDIPSFYPTLLALIVAFSATFYSSIQMFAPDMWKHFYFHPSLNPFVQPPALSVFLCAVWSIIIVALAAVDEIFHKLSFGEATHYLSGLIGICAINYIIFSITTLYYVGYLLFLIYVIFALYRYFKYSSRYYICGNCGAALHKKGKCPYCGTMNE